MSAPGDELLAVIAARRRMPWRAFSDAFDVLHLRALGTGSGLNDPVGSIRLRSLRLLSELAHAEILPVGAATSLAAAPTALARLPRPGLPRAVLAGSRDIGTAKLLRDACAPFRPDARVIVEAQPYSGGYAPTVIAIETIDEEVLQRVSQRVCIQLANQPPAWRILGTAASVAEYEASLTWTTDRDPEWRRHDFDLSTLAFGVDRQEAPIRLSWFTDPITHRQLHRIWRDGYGAYIDRDWGRWLRLREHQSQVLLFDRGANAVGVPTTVPLPRLLARALALFSGSAPLRQTHPLDQGLKVDVYKGVPIEAAELLGQKLGQNVITKPLLSRYTHARPY